jgi:hypothetical protein
MMGFLLSIIGFVGIFFLAVVGVNELNRGEMQATCSAFAQESGRQTKYAEYTYWSRDCLTKQEDGRWISTNNLRETN